MEFWIRQAIMILSVLLFIWLFYRQGNRKVVGDEWVMMYPRMALWPAIFLVPGLLLLAYLIISEELTDGGRVTMELFLMVGVLLIFDFMAIFLLLELKMTFIKFTPHQITSNSPWRKRRTILWEDISTIRYSRWSQLFVVIDRHSTVIRISPWMIGRRRFISEVRRRLPEKKYQHARAEFEIWAD